MWDQEQEIDFSENIVSNSFLIDLFVYLFMYLFITFELLYIVDLLNIFVIIN